MLKKLIISAILATTMATPAAAQWTYKATKSAFDNTETNVIANKSGRFLFGARCVTKYKDFIYVTDEKISDVDAINAAFPKLLVRIDNNIPTTLVATAEIRRGFLVIIAGTSTEDIEELAKAKKRVAVAIKINNKRYNEKIFDAVNSTKVANKFINACDSKEFK